MGEELKEDRAAQPGALLGQTLLPSGHEPLWGHGKTTTPISYLQKRVSRC